MTSVAALGDDPDDPAGQVGLDLVEQLHRLDEADDLADGDLAADLDVRRRAGGRRGVEDPGERRLDRRPAGGAGSRPAVGRLARAGPRARRSGGDRRPATARDGDRLAQDEPGPAGLDLELGQVGAVEQRRRAGR